MSGTEATRDDHLLSTPPTIVFPALFRMPRDKFRERLLATPPVISTIALLDHQCSPPHKPTRPGNMKRHRSTEKPTEQDVSKIY
ncbi:hypothetical protein PoB_004942900 [Plakobranchus ocellatus]|uniref:Uncharacterized protein n=1 Tax=Plakobranchus ocellatus TaxID=259542 RepID=A0AAV4BRX5_9GAST|nr:hypothetical protein PoB_004942900 [Plakobranchus ocellatus]